MSKSKGLWRTIQNIGLSVALDIKKKVEIAKLKTAIKKDDKSIAQFYRQIGEVYYKEHSNDAEECVTELVNSVSEKIQHIESLQEEIENIKSRTFTAVTEELSNVIDIKVSEEITDSTTYVTEEQTALYCPKCGEKFLDDMNFCMKCGAARAMQGTVVPAMEKSGRKKGGIIILIVIILAVFATVNLLGGIFKSGYVRVIDKYFKALENGDGDLYYSIMAEDYIDDRIDAWGYTENEIRENYRDSMQDKLAEYEAAYGDHIKITYKITDTYEPDSDQLIYLNRWMEDYGFSDDSIQDAVVVYCEYEVEGENGSSSYTTDRLIMKVNGKWCISGGYIEFSWYEQ